MVRALPILFLFFFQSLSAQVYYDVTFPNDTTLVGCGAVADTIFPKIIKYGTCSFAVGVSVTDKVFSAGASGQCSQIARRFRLVYWCDYDPNTTPLTTILNPFTSNQGAMAQGTAQNHGHLEYTQVIRVMDNQAPLFVDCPTGLQEICDYSPNDPNQYNDGHIDNCESMVDLSTKVTDVCSGADLNMRYILYLDMDNNGTMETVINSSDANAYPILETTSNDTLMASIDFSPNIELPYGKHKIQWFAKDNCGNQKTCLYEFLIKDCLNPTVVCKNGISVNIMQTGMITVPESVLLEYKSDNCTPTMQLKTGIQLAGASGIFPLNQHDVTFDCNQLGPQLVEVWAQDHAGNDDFCVATVTVQDNMGNCNQTTNRVGQLKTDKGLPLADATLRLRQSSQVGVQVYESTTDANGNFDFQNVPACGMSLELDLPNALKYLNTLDALALSMHLLGRDVMADPYRLLAADMDHDHALTAWDVDALVQRFLQKNNTHNDWIILPQNFVLPADPMQAALPDPTDLMNCVGTLSDSILLSVTSVGDVNGSWANGALDRDDKPELVYLTLNDRIFAAGETVAVEFTAPDIDGIPGFQLALKYNAEVLTLSTQQPGLVPLQWMYHNDAENIVACSWHNGILAQPALPKGMKPMAFRLVFLAKKAGTLSDVISLDEYYLKAEAYGSRLQKTSLALDFIPQTPVFKRQAEIEVSLFPNPSNGNATCTLKLPKAEFIELFLTDMFGMVQPIVSGNFGIGTHSFPIEQLKPGTYFIQLQRNNAKAAALRFFVE